MNTVLNQIKFFDNVITIDQLKEAQLFLNEHKWGLQSSFENQSDQFLLMELSKNSFFTKQIYKTISSLIGKKCRILRVYANGHFFGTPGRPHHDDTGKQYLTFILYTNPRWQITWGGQTVFYDAFMNDCNDIVNVSENVLVKYPKPCSGVLFPSNIIHYAECPTKECKELRTTVVYKLEISK